MNLTNARATFGLNATAIPISTEVSGSVRIGAANASISFPDADVAYSLRAIFAGSGDALHLDLTTASTAGSTSFVDGTAQVDTATIVAAGGCTSNGTMTLVLTSSGMTGSPLNVPVALTTSTHTTAALIAAAARTELAAVAVIAARFTIGGTGADITLTRKPTSTYTVSGGTLPLYAANDATLNLAIPSGLGVTADTTSTDTTAGVITSGTKIYDGDGNDFEGVSIPTLATVNAILINNQGDGSITVTGSSDAYAIGGGEKMLRSSTSAIGSDAALDFASGAQNDLTLTVIGQTA